MDELDPKSDRGTDVPDMVTWTPPRTRTVRIIAWIILVAMGLCVAMTVLWLFTGGEK